MRPRIIRDLDLGLRRVVELPIRDVPAVGRPFPRLRQTELLLVYPVEVTVEYVLRRVARQALLLVIGETRDVHVAAPLETQHRAVGRQLPCARAFRRQLKASVGERIDVEIGYPRASEERLEIGLEHQMLRVLRPLERIVAESLVRTGERLAGSREEQRVLPGGGVVGANHRG